MALPVVTDNTADFTDDKKVTKLVQLEQKCNKQQLLLLLDPFNGLFSSLDLNEARDDGVLGW